MGPPNSSNHDVVLGFVSNEDVPSSEIYVNAHCFPSTSSYDLYSSVDERKLLKVPKGIRPVDGFSIRIVSYANWRVLRNER